MMGGWEAIVSDRTQTNWKADDRVKLNWRFRGALRHRRHTAGIDGTLFAPILMDYHYSVKKWKKSAVLATISQTSGLIWRRWKL